MIAAASGALQNTGAHGLAPVRDGQRKSGRCARTPRNHRRPLVCIRGCHRTGGTYFCHSTGSTGALRLRKAPGPRRERGLLHSDPAKNLMVGDHPQVQPAAEKIRTSGCCAPPHGIVADQRPTTSQKEQRDGRRKEKRRGDDSGAPGSHLRQKNHLWWWLTEANFAAYVPPLACLSLHRSLSTFLIKFARTPSPQGPFRLVPHLTILGPRI